MSEKEKYLDYIQVIDGKESWKASAMSYVEKDVFRKHPDKAWALINDDPKNIELFSVQFLMDNRKMVDYVFNRTFNAAREGREESYLRYIPFQVLRQYYTDVLRLVSENGMFIKFVPFELQNEYVQIPYEAVKQNPASIKFCSPRALIDYPDICLMALKAGWENFFLIPSEVRNRFSFNLLN